MDIPKQSYQSPLPQTNVTYSSLGEVSAGEIRHHFEEDTELVSFAISDVQAYKIVYDTTDHEGKLVRVSGVVAIPKHRDDTALPTVILNRGTIFSEERTASNGFLPKSAIWKYALLPASHGFVALAADYIGYGESRLHPHPYQHANTLSAAVRNLVVAWNVCKKEFSIQMSDKLFLGGYSEGGFATLAALRDWVSLSEKPNVFDLQSLTAVSAGAGAYDMKTTFDAILQWDVSLANPSYLVMVALSYKSMYNISHPLEYIFSERNVQAIQKGIYGGELSRQEINDFLDSEPSKLFSAEFLEHYRDGSDMQTLGAFEDNRIELAKNSMLQELPIRLFHGKEDMDVPLFNSEQMYQASKSTVAGNMELVMPEGVDHFEGSRLWLMDTLRFFRTFV